LGVLVLAAVAVRVAAGLVIGNRFYFADEATYVDTAYGLLQGHGFGAGYREAPGYPVVLAALLLVLPRTILALRLAQGVLGGLGAALIFALTSRLAGRGPALAATAIYVLDPLLVVSAALLYPEMIAALVLAALILAALHDRNALGWSLGLGILLGVIALLRPVALVLIPVVAVWCALAPKLPVGRGLAHLALIVAGSLLMLSPWTYRNYRHQGQLAPIARAGTHMAPVGQEQVVREGLTVSILKKAWTDPLGLAARTARQFVQFWELAPTRLTTDDPEQRIALHRTDPRLQTGSVVPSGPRDLVSILASTVEFALALIGLIVLYKRQRRAALLISMVIVTFGLGYALFVAKLRYRIPILPLVFVLAGIGAWRLGTLVTEFRRKPVG
jgi:hypothetical protein